jgi:DNA-binding XRE family transcriptional regulator
MESAQSMKHKSFDDWIDETGNDEIAEILGVSRTTVIAWRNGVSDPRVDLMRKIKKITRGKIGYVQIIDRPSRSESHIAARFEKKLAARRP